MDGCWHHLLDWAEWITALNPLQRIDATREQLENEISIGWVWIIIVSACLAAATAVLAVALIRKTRQLRHSLRAHSFDGRSEDLGLSAEERSVLTNLARLAGLANPRTIFTTESVFNQAVDRLMRSPRVTAMPEPMQKRLTTMIALLREKLGFWSPAAAETSAGVTTRQVLEDSGLSIIASDGSQSLQATVIGNSPEGILAAPEEKASLDVGQALLARYTNLGSVWEFDTEVLSAEDDEILLKHTNKIRFINRRRFPRIRTHMQAYLARLPFWQDGPEMQAPAFVPAELVEIAGPGLLLEAEAKPHRGERVVVVIALGEGKIVQNMGKVRRVSPGTGKSSIAVEMTDLLNAEITEMVRATNAAANQASVARAEAAGAPASA